MSETSIETTEAPIETEATTEAVETTDLSAEVEKWKALSRKNEQQAKANAEAAKELENLRRQSMTETEKLVEAAREETRRSIQLEYAGKVVDAELKSALNGKTLEASAVLEFNKGAFINESGDVDTNAIQAWVDAHTAKAETVTPNLGQGNRGTKTSPKSTGEQFADWLKGSL